MCGLWGWGGRRACFLGLFVNFLNIDLNLLIEKTKPASPFPNLIKNPLSFVAGSTNLAPHSGLASRISDVRSRRRGCACPDKVKVWKSLRTLAKKIFILTPREEKFVAVVLVVVRSKLSQRISGTLPNALPSILYQHSAETFLAYRQH